jgi:hypothetical protein
MMPVVEQEPHFFVMRCTRMILGSAFNRRDQYSTRRRRWERAFSSIRIVSAVEKDREDDIDRVWPNIPMMTQTESAAGRPT